MILSRSSFKLLIFCVHQLPRVIFLDFILDLVENTTMIVVIKEYTVPID
jgi:hypothetical protein